MLLIPNFQPVNFQLANVRTGNAFFFFRKENIWKKQSCDDYEEANLIRRVILLDCSLKIIDRHVVCV